MGDSKVGEGTTAILIFHPSSSDQSSESSSDWNSANEIVYKTAV
jgi:hypothetical protein